MAKKIARYVAENGRCPFDDWYLKLPTRKQALVFSYIDKAARGGTKRNIKPLKGGLYEIKINTEGGLRVYFGESADQVILLLAGGNKNSQKRDIIQARKLWREHGK